MIGMPTALCNTTAINMAGTAAEAAASAAARGQRIKCNRGLGWMTLRECVGLFLAGQGDPEKEKNKCARELGCASGRERAKRFQEDGTMANYGTCVECGKKGNRNAENQCYGAACKKARRDRPTLVDDLTPKESPLLDAEEVAVLDAVLDAVLSGPSQERSPESIKSYMRELGEMLDTADDGVAAGQDVTCHDPVADAAALDAVMGLGDVQAAAGAALVSMNAAFAPVYDALDNLGHKLADLTKPFSFAGFDFDPGLATPPPGRPIARLAPSGSLNFSRAATQTHDLGRFQYVRVIPDKTGSALALIFLAEKAGGARKLAVEGKAALKTSAEAVARVAPGLVGKALELRPMGQDGVFVAVAVEEAA